MEKKSRFGEVDFWKFFFSLVIMLFHATRALEPVIPMEWTLFENGALAVQFFFIVSGFFFLPSIESFERKTSQGNLFSQNIRFIGGKIKAILPLYLISVVLGFAVSTSQFFYLHETFNFLDYMFTMAKSMWNILLLNSAVTAQLNINSPVWYLSAMFIAMFILTPIARKYRSLYVKYICPIASLIICGVLVGEHSLQGVYNLTPLNLTRGLLVGLMDIMIGSMLYEFSLYLKSKKLNKRFKITLTVMGYLSLAYIICLMQIYTRTIMLDGYDWRVNFTSLVPTALVVLMMCSGLSVSGKIYNNKASAFLGRLSTAIFLLHAPCVKLVDLWFPKMPYFIGMLWVSLLSIAVSLIGMWLSGWVSKIKIKKLFLEEN